MVHLSGLEGLRKAYSISITHNNLLESLDGLSNIEEVGEFEVTKNKILPQCDAKQFAAQRSDETRVGQNAGPSCE